MHLEREKSLLLKRKLEESRAERARQRKEKERKRIAENIDGFYEKYRFADEAESGRIRAAAGRPELFSLTDIPLPHGTVPDMHGNMYLCFLCGSEELLDIYIFGSYDDLMSDMDNWDFFSPYLLLIDEEFSRYIYIRDNGEMICSSF